MRIIPSFTVLTAMMALLSSAAPLSLRAEDGVAVAIIYDTSGSMKDPVRDANGKRTPKYLIANRALMTIAQQLQAFTTNSASGAPRKVEAGLFIFNGDGARAAVKFSPLDEAALEKFAREFSNPTGATPLGNALKTANDAVLKSSLSRKHVLVITDGMNTAGPAPEKVLATLQETSKEKFQQLSVHFVAFDVDAKIFNGVKKLGATVVGAADEKQLDTQLQYIVQQKILLEEEEPKR